MARPRTTWGLTRLFGASLASVMLVTTLPAVVATVAQEASTDGLCPADHTVPASPSAASEPTPEPSPSRSAERPSEPADAPAGLTNLGGTWRDLPRSPFAAVRPVVVWADDRMVAIDYVSGRTATYDPSVRRWEEHQPIPGESDPQGTGWAFDGLAQAAPTGSEVIVSGSRHGPDSSWRAWYAFDPATGRWRDVAPSPLGSPYGGHLAWTGDLLLAVSGRDAAAYDPAADCWLELPQVPLPELPENAMTARADEWAVRSIHWTGDELSAVVVRVEEDGSAGIVSFEPSSWTWTPGPIGPIDGDLVDPVLAEGVLWFISEDRGDARGGLTTNATYDPATDTWARLETDCRINTRWATWTGRLIMEPYRDRRAFDPMTGACYRTAASRDRAREWEPVWTGREFLYWSGAYGDTFRAFRDGIAYRPPRQAITDELAKPMGKKLERAIEARRHYGFDTDPEVVREIMRDRYQPGSYAHGFPMTEAEQHDLWRRSSFAGRASDVKGWLRQLPTFGGLWQDQRTGGAIVIALTEADPELLRGIDQRFAPYDTPTPWRLVVVPRTERELKRALWRVGAVSKRLDPDAMLWAAGVDLSAGGLSLMYDPDDVGRVRPRKAELEKRLGVPVNITSGRVRDL